jgi:hypothetical protein
VSWSLHRDHPLGDVISSPYPSAPRSLSTERLSNPEKSRSFTSSAHRRDTCPLVFQLRIALERQVHWWPRESSTGIASHAGGHRSSPAAPTNLRSRFRRRVSTVARLRARRRAQADPLPNRVCHLTYVGCEAECAPHSRSAAIGLMRAARRAGTYVGRDRRRRREERTRPGLRRRATAGVASRNSRWAVKPSSQSNT